MSEPRVDASLARELDHPRREVDRDDVEPVLAVEPVGELAEPAADVEHAPRREAGDELDRDVVGEPAVGDERPVDGVPRREPFLARVLPLDDERVVDLQRVRIGLPEIPLDGVFPPSQALTVAPTSPNSPSCLAPFAERPCTYVRSIAYSRE